MAAEMVDVKQAARVAGVSVKTIYRYLWRYDRGEPGGLPSRRRGAGSKRPHRLILRDDLKRVFGIA